MGRASASRPATLVARRIGLRSSRLRRNNNNNNNNKKRILLGVIWI
jgi:hypothetical protein